MREKRTIIFRAELAELFDQWIEKHRDFLRLFNADNRSSAFSYILVQLLIKEGMVTDQVLEEVNAIDWGPTLNNLS